MSDLLSKAVSSGNLDPSTIASLTSLMAMAGGDGEVAAALAREMNEAGAGHTDGVQAIRRAVDAENTKSGASLDGGIVQRQLDVQLRLAKAAADEGKKAFSTDLLVAKECYERALDIAKKAMTSGARAALAPSVTKQLEDVAMRASSNLATCLSRSGGDDASVRSAARVALELREACVRHPGIAAKAAVKAAKACINLGDCQGAQRAASDARKWSPFANPDVKASVVELDAALGIRGTADKAEANMRSLVEASRRGPSAFQHYLETDGPRAWAESHPDIPDVRGGNIVDLALILPDVSLVSMALRALTEAGACVNLQNDASRPLLKAANLGLEGVVRALLNAGAPVNEKDDDGFSALHTATVDFTPRHRDVVRILLEAGADVNAVNRKGFTPLMYVVQQRGSRDDIKMLLNAGAHVCEAWCDLFGLSAYGFAYGVDAGTAQLLFDAAAAAGEDTSALDEERRAQDLVNWHDDVLVPATNAQFQSLEETIAAAQIYGSPEGKMQAYRQDLDKVRAMLPADADVFSIEGNPLLVALTAMSAKFPAIFHKRFHDDAELSDYDIGMLQRVRGNRQEDSLLIQHDDLSPGYFISSACVRYLESVAEPLKHVFAFSVPTAEALDAVAEATKMAGDGGVVEIGAGSGYWAGLLRARGVPVEAYDWKPPDNGVRNMYFTHTYTTVLEGSVEKLAGKNKHVLLLVWPFNEEESAHAFDAEALAAFEGDVVVHAGDLESTINTSLAFADMLRARFEEVRRVSLPSWPHHVDVLSVWRRMANVTK